MKKKETVLSVLCDIRDLLQARILSMPVSVPIVESKHIIDCDAPPFCPDGLTVESHTQGGQLSWDASKVEMYLSEKQKTGWMKGTDLLKELEGKKVLNANVLDDLLAHPKLIPDSWKGKYIFFWGTIYRNSRDDLYVRYLGWDGGAWCWSRSWLDFKWDGRDPAAVSAS